MSVDPHEASLDLCGDPMGLRQVLRPNARAEPVLARIRELHTLPVTLEQNKPVDTAMAASRARSR